MKIAHVITRLVAGGAQRNTLTCAKYQQQAGHQVTVLSGVEVGSEGSLLEEAADADYRWVAVPPLVRRVHPWLDLQATLQLMRHFCDERYDLVHTHTSKAGLVGRLAARLCGVPVVIHTPHGHVFHSYFSPLKTRIFQALERAAAGLPDVMVMLSSQELADHIRFGVLGNVRAVIVPSGVDLASFRQLHCGADPFVIGYVGRLADIKGPLDLVESFSVHKQSFPESRLLMVGDGPQRSEVESRIDGLGLREAVEITGWQSDVRGYLERMSLLAVPSHNEGMGRVVVEAMSAGLPVVASSVGGLLDLVDHDRTGLLVAPRDHAGWAKAFGLLVEQPGLAQRMGAAGRLRAEKFSQTLMLDRLEMLYQQIWSLKRPFLGEFEPSDPS